MTAWVLETDALPLPPSAAVEGAPLDSLPAFIGALEILKAKALARFLDNPSPASTDGSVPGEDHYLTVEQVAGRLGLTEQYVYEAIRKGDLPAIEIGPKKYKRVALTELRAWTATKKLDPSQYFTYSRDHGRRRGPADTQATRTHATRTRGPSRRRTEQRSSLGARGTRRARVSRPIDAALGAAVNQAPTWQEEYLSDGLH